MTARYCLGANRMGFHGFGVAGPVDAALVFDLRVKMAPT